MSRNKIDANTDVFRRLDEYCGRRGEPILNAGTARWIQTQKTDADREFLVYSSKVQELLLSPTLRIGRFDHRNRSYFITAGFDFPEIPEELQEEDLTGGMLTAFLSEMTLRPVATPIEVREVVEVADNKAAGYDGHDCTQIASLFPLIQVVSSEILADNNSSNIFLLLCLCDRRRYDHWIDEDLAAAIKGLSNLSTSAIPFDLLCRAVLDFDPSSLFLALYRCMEALYSREKTMALMNDLGIQKDWAVVAQSLESQLGWYPREEASLEDLLTHAKEADMNAAVSALNESVPEESKISSFTARRVYALRNGLVHYRSFRSLPYLSKIDWCRLCEAMVSVVSDVYAVTFPGTPSVVSPGPTAEGEPEIAQSVSPN
jgi:hypothetical protein